MIPPAGANMIRKILFVDDDEEMLLAVKEGLEKYKDSFSVLFAEDGMEAVGVLERQNVSVVVTDLKMPRMDGFHLLAHVMENMPEIPVIIITGYSTPEMKRLAKEGGAIGYISKPFLIEDLAQLVSDTLRKESEGGVLHSVNSGMFLQLMEMEEKTCTIRLVEKNSLQEGILFFREGRLLDAKSGREQGIDAAYTILAWDQVNLCIKNECPRLENRIQSDLQSILLEAARRKDEAQANDPNDAEPVGDVAPLPDIDFDEPIEPVSKADTLRDLLDREVGDRCGLVGISTDGGLDELVFKMRLLGNLFHLGAMKSGYFATDDNGVDTVLVPGETSVVIRVDPKCPRDKIMRVLNEHLG